MCTVLLLPGDNPIAVNKYIISYHIKLRDKVSNSYKTKLKIIIFDTLTSTCETGIKAFTKRPESGISRIKSAPKFAKRILIFTIILK
jgi:hypothetical protein